MSAILDPIKQATIPFSALKSADEINARPATKDGLDELAASILSKGIIQPLCVRPSDNGEKYELIDGRRRHAAIAKLVKEKRLPKSHPVPVIIRNEDDEQALESSLIANTVRLPMHAVDQFVVFAKLAGEGASDADIAARFGIPERQVRQQRALGRLAPAIREAWKKDKISAEVAKAFAEHGDAGVQEALYDKLKKQGNYGLTEHSVRSELSRTREAVRNCKELRVVGEDAYLAAGGTISESLFAEDRFVDDVPLVTKLARDRLQIECDKLTAEGWAWAKVNLDDDDPSEWDFEPLIEDADAAGDHDYTAEEKAKSGCLVTVNWQGTIELVVELVPEGEDQIKDKADDNGPDTPDDDENRAEGDEPTANGEAAPGEAATSGVSPYDVSGALLNAITETKTLAAAKALARDPDLARDVVYAALIARFMAPAVIRNDGMPALREDNAMTFAEALAWVRRQPDTTRELRFAQAVSQTLDLRESTWQFKNRDSGIDTLIEAISGHWYLAAIREAFLAMDYFKRATKETALAAIAEIKEAGLGHNLAPVDELGGMKKADLALAAAEAAVASGWLPPQLRHPEYALCLPKSEAA